MDIFSICLYWKYNQLLHNLKFFLKNWFQFVRRHQKELCYKVFFQVLPLVPGWADLFVHLRRWRLWYASLTGESVRAHFSLFFFIASTSPLTKFTDSLHPRSLCLLRLCLLYLTKIAHVVKMLSQTGTSLQYYQHRVTTANQAEKKALLNTGLAWNFYYCCSLHFN